MRKLNYSKYHGLENDFLVIDLNAQRLPAQIRGEIAAAICARHTGVGGDGVIYYRVTGGAGRMYLFNADGSEAEVSGNGLRILAQHLYQGGLIGKRRFAIYSAAGVTDVKVVSSRGRQQLTQVKMPPAKFALPDVPMRGASGFFVGQPFATASGSLVGTAVNAGNPHIVFFVDHFDFDWRTFGSEVTVDPRFPQETNVEFALIKSKRRLEHRVWERGVGETRASGTGAAAVVAAGVINGFVEREVTVVEPAGELEVSIDSSDESISLTGPSVKIGDGIFLYEPDEPHSL